MSEIKSPFSALRQFARDAAKADEEYCDLCAVAIHHEHRHLLDLTTRELLCVCQACRLLFDRPAAGGGTRRLVPTRYLLPRGFEITGSQWESLRVPVNIVFFCKNTAAERVVALYPSPMGPTESSLSLETWTELETRNPILRDMEPDVEALLVNRVRGAEYHLIVPIDECYKLVGLIRAYWKGLSGGKEVWQEIDQFFAGLQARAVSVGTVDA